MFDKSFNEMYAVDVSQWLKAREKTPDVKYLPWTACKKILHDYGAEQVMFWPVPGPDGCTLRKSELEFLDKNGVANRCYEVLVHIKVDQLEWETTYPVLNENNPVKDNSMNQLRVHNAVRRAFVKGVAERLGLGFSLWMKDDDLPEQEPVEDLSKHSLAKCKQRLTELVTAKINAGIPLNIMADRLGMDEDTLRGKFSLYNELARLEKSIWEMRV